MLHNERTTAYFYELSKKLATWWGFPEPEPEDCRDWVSLIGNYFVLWHQMPDILDYSITTNEFEAWQNDQGKANLTEFVKMVRSNFGRNKRMSGLMPGKNQKN